MPFLAGIGAWFANNKLAQQIALGLAAVVAVNYGYKTWKHNVEQGIRRQEREARERAVLTGKVIIAETRQQISEERTNERAEADRAVAALPDDMSIGELRHARPDIYSRLWPDAPGGGGEAESR